jgi:hypothetical protein
MLGWNISVFRQVDDGLSPAKAGSEKGVRLAVWQTGLEGLKWLDALVEAGHAIDLGGNGYPNYYTAQAEHLIPRIIDGPPEANPTWSYGPHDVVTSQWEGKTTIDRAAIEDCRSDEWLLVVAWDES